MWGMSIDDYIKICEISIAVGIQPGQSMEAVLREYMKAKGVKPSMTDLTKDELIEKLVKDGKGILDIETNEDGVQDMHFFKKDEDEKE